MVLKTRVIKFAKYNGNRDAERESEEHVRYWWKHKDVLLSDKRAITNKKLMCRALETPRPLGISLTDFKANRYIYEKESVFAEMYITLSKILKDFMA